MPDSALVINTSAKRHGHTRDAPRLAEPTAFIQRTIESVAVELVALQDQGISDVLVERQARHARLANMHNNACGGVLEV